MSKEIEHLGNRGEIAGVDKAEYLLIKLREQRELALAWMLISIAISVAVILSNFPGNRKPIEEAKAAVDMHQKLLGGEEKVLKANEVVLRESKEALQSLVKAGEVH
jgi:hypothetical protein